MAGRRGGLGACWPDVLGVACVVAAGLGTMVPALRHGASLGPYNLLGLAGLSRAAHPTAYNLQMIDQVEQFIPWTTEAWRQVHQGHLPLWNPYGALGMPLGFSWLAAPFSVPALLAYLAPLRLAYTVQVLVTLVIAGTGVYTLCRILRIGVAGAVMGAVTFELGGSFFGWLGWSVAGVMAWEGWLFAAAVLVVRGVRRGRAIVLLAVVVACACLAGQPETLLLLLLGLAVWTAVVMVQRTPRLGGRGPVLRPCVALVAGVVAGDCLAAPFALPAAQLSSAGTRQTQLGGPALPLHDLTHFLLQGFDGLPLAGSVPLARGNWYSESAAYVGVIALVLAAVAVAVDRRPELLAFAGVVLAGGVLVFVHPLDLVLNHLPLLRAVAWHRALVSLTFALAVLSGYGLDALLRPRSEARARRWGAAGFAVAAIVLGLLWVFGRGHLTPVQARVRDHSFLWPVVGTALGLVATGALAATAWWRRRRRPSGAGGAPTARTGRWVALGLLGCQAASVIAAGAPLWSSSPTFLATTAAEAALVKTVGSGVVGMGDGNCTAFFTPGIVPDVNVAYRVHELAVYDPDTPQAYARSWATATGHVVRDPLGFCPAVTTVAVARLYGVRYVVEPHDVAGPAGAVPAGRVGDEELYAVPGAAAATLTPAAPGPLPGPAAPGTPVAVTHADPSRWRVATAARGWTVLRLRLTDDPGWHGSIDGRPLALRRFAGVMLEARVPPGRHVITLRYWPAACTVGVVLASVAALGLGAAAWRGSWLERSERRR